jgi:hypothetical protein
MSFPNFGVLQSPGTPDSSMAHQTVRCVPVTVGSGHASPVDFVLISLPTVGASIVGSPDSPSNFSRSVPNNSREQRVRRRASLGTGQCPVHPQAGEVWLGTANLLQTNLILFDKVPST